jgi:TPR repeat protein
MNTAFNLREKADDNLKKANALYDTNFEFVGITTDSNPNKGVCMVFDSQKNSFRFRVLSYSTTGSYHDIYSAKQDVVGILAIPLSHCVTNKEIRKQINDFKEDRVNRFFMHELARSAFGKFGIPVQISECNLSFTMTQLIEKVKVDTLKQAETDRYTMYNIAQCYEGLDSPCQLDGVPFWSQDSNAALIWYQKAAALGHRGAAEAVQRLKEIKEGWYGVPHSLQWNIYNRKI